MTEVGGVKGKKGGGTVVVLGVEEVGAGVAAEMVTM